LSLFDELKRRNVFKVGIAYVVSAWLLLQFTEVLVGLLGLPENAGKYVILLLVIGFPVALFFAWAFELTPEGIKKERNVDRSRSITKQTGRKLDFTIIGVMAVALAYFAYDKLVLSTARDAALVEATTQAMTEQTAAEDTPAQVDKSIAVLPFINMSSDKEQEYFSDGISEEILNALAKVKGLQVTGRTSSFAFKGQNQDLREIGKALGVNHILEGSVRKSGNTVRITAQLIQVDNGFHLWSEAYDRELDDVFAIQDEIANNILQQLKATLLGEEVTVVTAARTDTQAYDLYLLAKQRMYERTGPTIEDAAELLDRAIAIDPDYAPAYAQRGIASLLLAEGGGGYGNIPREQAESQAKLYLDKALALDSNLAEAWAGLGLYYYGQPTGAKQLKAIEVLQKALAINPGMINASNWLSIALGNMGRPAEAYDVMMGMIARDPLYRPGIGNAVGSFISFGQQEQALAFLDRIRPLIPNDAVMRSSEAAIHLSLGQVAESLALIESSIALDSSSAVVRLRRRFAWMDSHQYERVAAEGESWLPVYALAYLGRDEEASILAFKRADERADVGTLFNYLNIAGRSDELIAYLEERWPNLDALRVDFPPFSAIGDFLMLDVALAYSRAGNQQRFNEALEHVRTVHENLKTAGVKRSIFLMSEAAHQALAGDIEISLDYLDRAISQGLITTTKITREWPALSPLEGNPQFEAIQTRMIEHLNNERQKLGLDPLST
jgi:TolB-like protein/Tfp pilus assembly protein PilF